MVKIENIRKIEELVNKLPDPEKDRPIISIDGKLFSWKTVLQELKREGNLADKIEAQLMEKTK